MMGYSTRTITEISCIKLTTKNVAVYTTLKYDANS